MGWVNLVIEKILKIDQFINDRQNTHGGAAHPKAGRSMLRKPYRQPNEDATALLKPLLKS